jgi:hypothetical protein
VEAALWNQFPIEDLGSVLSLVLEHFYDTWRQNDRGPKPAPVDGGSHGKCDPTEQYEINQGERNMAKVNKSTDSSSLAEVVDRILDKGIVIDAWVKVSLVGIELLSIEARVVIASVETYLKYAEAIGLTASAAAPA